MVGDLKVKKRIENMKREWKTKYERKDKVMSLKVKSLTILLNLNFISHLSYLTFLWLLSFESLFSIPKPHYKTCKIPVNHKCIVLTWWFIWEIFQAYAIVLSLCATLIFSFSYGFLPNPSFRCCEGKWRHIQQWE